MTQPSGDARRSQTETLRIQMKAALVKCCEAGRVAYLEPCPWHGEDGWPAAWRISVTFPADADMPDFCPEGCGRTTEDPYGGPCNACWADIE